MKILGQTPYDGGCEFISDHYGILVKLRFREQAGGGVGAGGGQPQPQQHF